MSKVLMVSFLALIVAVFTVSAGPGCSRVGAGCGAYGSVDCCSGLFCSTQNFKCEAYIGPDPRTRGGRTKVPPPVPPRPASSIPAPAKPAPPRPAPPKFAPPRPAPPRPAPPKSTPPKNPIPKAQTG